MFIPKYRMFFTFTEHNKNEIPATSLALALLYTNKEIISIVYKNLFFCHPEK